MGIPVDGTTTHEEEEEDLFKRVEKGLRSALQLNQTWDAMPCAWLTAWRQSHEASPSSSSSPPSCAPIDFSPLIEAASTKGREREEEEEVFSLTPMRRGLIEGEDFVWLPHDLVTSLIRRYGTILSQTTRISRRVVRVGRADSSFLQIETHPPFVRIFDAKGNALRADYFSRKTPLSTLMMSRNGSDGGSKMCLTFSETKEEEGASSSFHLTLKNRLWCAVSEGNAAPSIAFKEGERPAAAGMKITSDFTDCIAHQESYWRLVREVEEGSLEDLQDPQSTVVKLMVEEPHSNEENDVFFPLDGKLYAWQKFLRIGDEVDCVSKSGKWYDAIITFASQSSSSEDSSSSSLDLVVHLRGFEESQDLRFKLSPLDKAIQPLYSQEHTDWRLHFHVGTLVEVKLGTHWVIGRVKHGTKRKNSLTSSLPSSSSSSSSQEWEIEVSAAQSKVGTVIKLLPADSELLCRVHTHTSSAHSSSSSITGSIEEGNGAKRASYSADSSHHTSVSTKLMRSTPLSSSAKSASSIASSSYGSSYGNRRTTGGTKGATGLTNLGNTCFMNSMLQCLSNTQALTLHFLRDDEAYKEDINEDNPLGCGGRIAIAYANLLKEMWSGEFSVVSPAAFKTVIGEFSPQFSGYQQQDSQELMNALLDGLHEDLNKVLRKPYVETVDSNGRPDDVVSREAWTNHLRRNDSIVNDLCFGQMKSHITCVSCGATSVTFDPYSLLSLPIPIDTSKTLKLPVFRFNGMERSDITISVDFSRTVLELKAAIAAELQMKRDVSTLAICALTRTNDGTYGRISKTFADAVLIKDLFKGYQPEPVVVYELPIAASAASIAESPRSYAANITPPRGTVDICFGHRAKTYILYSSSASVTFTSAPRRFYLPPNNDPSSSPSSPSSEKEEEEQGRVTRNMIYIKVAEMVAESAKLPLEKVLAEIPFSLYQGANGYIQHLIPNDDELFEFDRYGGDTLLCIWSEEVLGGKHWLVPSVLDQCGVDDFSFAHEQVQQSKKNKEALTLNACLDKFSESEQMASEETFYCSKCKQHLAPLKKLDIWAVPDVLIIHLKRFQYSKGIYFVQREKITDLVTFPVHDLDLTSYVKGPIHAEAPPIYDLYAVSEHSGGLGGGHYTAKCCNFIDNCWYDFNDSSVTPTTAEKSVSPQAYVLFYKRKKGSLRWGGLSILSLPPSSSPSEEIMMGVEEEQLSEHPSPNHMEF